MYVVEIQYRLIAIDYSHHFLFERAKSSDRNQKHQSVRSASAFHACGDKDKGKFVLDQFFEAYGYALDRHTQQGC
jgi:hypothetical protein